MNLVTMHLSRLTDFSGRENRQPFWLWVLSLYIFQMILSFAVMIPLMVGMTSRIESLQGYDQAYLDAHPEVASKLVMGTMMPFFTWFPIIMIALVLLQIGLMAAAVTRRLHDTNRSGYWALPVAIAQCVMLGGYAIAFPRMFSSIAALGPKPPPDAINGLFASIVPVFAISWLAGLVGFVFMIVLIVFCATRGTVGPNRYGDDLLPPPVMPYWQQPGYQQPYHQQPPWQPPASPPPPPPARVVGPWSGPPRP